MDVTEVKSQKLSLLLADFQLCRHCQIVDRDLNRLRVGYECPVCSTPSPGGMMYFGLSIHTLINLMQEAFHAASQIHDELTEITIETDAHNISVVLFFCTLREILLNHLIGELCQAHKIPESIHKRLIADNRLHTQKQERLLPSLVGKKWKELIQEQNQQAQIDYEALNDFLQKAVKARNKFTHEGSKWGIDRQLAVGCIRQISPLLNFYVGVHNSYVHPYFRKSKLVAP